MGARGDAGRLRRPHNTLAFPPPKQNPSVTPANRAVTEDESLPENFFHGGPLIVDWKDPWDGLLEEVSPPRRRWPAVIAFTLTGLVVSLIGVAGVRHLRPQIAANARPSEPTVEPRQEQRATATHGSNDAVLRVETVIDTKKPQTPSVDERQAAQPGALETKPNASPTVPPPAATQAAGLAAFVGQRSNSATAKGPGELTVATAQKPVRAAKSSARRQSAQRQAARYTNKSTSKSRAEDEYGIPVDQIYTNSQGELVDAQGKPLPSKKERAQVPRSDAEAVL